MDEQETGRPAAAAPKRARATAAGRRRAKPVRWSAGRERRFLDALAQTANVAGSVRAAGLSESNVYRRRRKHDAFRAAWLAALREGYAKLETMLLERALNGVEKAVWHGGKQVGTAREYSDRLALALLTAHRGSVTGAEAAADPAMSEAAMDAELLRRLADMNLRLGGEG